MNFSVISPNIRLVWKVFHRYCPGLDLKVTDAWITAWLLSARDTNWDLCVFFSSSILGWVQLLRLHKLYGLSLFLGAFVYSWPCGPSFRGQPHLLYCHFVRIHQSKCRCCPFFLPLRLVLQLWQVVHWLDLDFWGPLLADNCWGDGFEVIVVESERFCYVVKERFVSSSALKCWFKFFA